MVLMAGCGSSASPAENQGPIGHRKAVKGPEVCTLVPAEQLARQLNVSKIEKRDGPLERMGSCSWVIPIDGAADPQLSLHGEARLGFGKSDTVGGVRARRQYESHVNACTVSVALSGTTDPAAGDDKSSDPAISVRYSGPTDASETEVCKAADAVAETYLRALPMA
ncbi:hypothetical protein [Lentzea guizhouensis]|uniref:hypothetical protein n=1 Tax=Lentzea guizhouensis TaxID=1586287 RepID=UPI0012B6A6DB|nr:hypothetical protein [Lentzea guizhouensis]